MKIACIAVVKDVPSYVFRIISTELPSDQNPPDAPGVEGGGVGGNEGAGCGRRRRSTFDYFKSACACISTRGFHLGCGPASDRGGVGDGSNDGASAIGGVATTDAPYTGPFLLPLIDLLNHSSSLRRRCTSLQRMGQSAAVRTAMAEALGASGTPEKTGGDIGRKRGGDGNRGGSVTVGSGDDEDGSSFIMGAERNIVKGEEILHSYGDQLTSAHQLQTFGFVEERYIQRAIDCCQMISTLRRDHSCVDDIDDRPTDNVVQQPQCDGDIDGNPLREEFRGIDTKTMTPATLSKAAVIEACASIASSSYPQQLRDIGNGAAEMVAVTVVERRICCEQC